VGYRPPGVLARVPRHRGPTAPVTATDGGQSDGGQSDSGQSSATSAGVYAGDGASDVGAAWNAGLDAIHVERHGHHRREQCVLGDYRVESFDELLGMAESN